jgi:carbonic anhydrase
MVYWNLCAVGCAYFCFHVTEEALVSSRSVLGILGLGLSLSFSHAFASDAHGVNPAEMKARAHEALVNIVTDNASFVSKHNKQCFDPFLGKQTPRVTLVSCSDSRVHIYAMDDTPDNDLFVIRNIGNQVISGEGSVEYGVRHLNTSLLFVMGHTGCGAVKAALGETGGLEKAIQKELVGVELKKFRPEPGKDLPDEVWLDGVRKNVNQQVAFALKKFKKEVDSGKLAVVGGVYDLHNKFGEGHGKVVVINVNGATNPEDIKRAPLLKDIPVFVK